MARYIGIDPGAAIDRPPGEVFGYLADARNWPQWPVVIVRAIEAAGEPGRWTMITPRGTGELRHRGDAATGLPDHDCRAPRAAWTVAARAVPNGRGAEFRIAFFQPPVLDDDEFGRQVALIDAELAPNWRLSN